MNSYYRENKMNNRVSYPEHIKDWYMAISCGLIFGILIGIALMMGFTHGIMLIVTGILLGLTSALISRTHRVLTAVLSGIIAVITAVITIIIIQVGRGHWPITNEATIQHYGTEEAAVIRITIFLVALILVPSFMAAVPVAFVKQHADKRKKKTI